MPGWLHKIKRSNFVIKLTHWEYWPFGVLQFPLFFYYPWLSMRSGSFTFFAGSNPGITMGGMLGESKYEVLQKLPTAVVPKTAFVRKPTTVKEVLNLIEREGFSLPVIFKPDLGERGFMVKKIRQEDDIVHYLSKMKNDFLIQELVDFPHEFGVFYRRFPDSEKGEVTSIVMKEMLSVVGDGMSTLQDLMLANDRAKLQWEILRETYKSRLKEVVAAGEKQEIVSIGNHCLGTKFLNGNHLITPRLSNSFDNISKQIDGFYFGRFDLRCASLDALAEGKVLVLELNGCGAEPAHIYDPDFSIWKALWVLIEHWNSIFKIAQQNKTRGFRFLPLKEAVFHLRNFREKVNS
jgi:hypothetical protein